MTVLKVGFVGIRSDRLDETVALFRDIIGVPVTRQTDDQVGFRLAVECAPEAGQDQAAVLTVGQAC